jgi:hypothetical protein
MTQLASQRSHALGVFHRFRIGKEPFDLAGPLDGLSEAIAKAQVSGVAGAALVARPFAYF